MSFLAAQCLYIRVYPNKVRVRNVTTQKETSKDAAEPFTSQRLLIGHYTHGERTIESAVKEVLGNTLRPPKVLIQPMAMCEGGLSQVENRVLLELAETMNRKAKVWVGAELTDAQVIEKLSAA